MKTNRIAAFTFMEITIAMLIAGICLGIAYFALNLFFNAFRSQNTSLQQEFGFYSLFSQFQKDIDRSTFFTWDGTELKTNYINEKIVTYTFKDDMLIRRQNEVSTDTMQVKIETLQLRYIPKLNIEILTTFSMDIIKDGKRIPIEFEKKYSAEELIHFTHQIEKYEAAASN